MARLWRASRSESGERLHVTLAGATAKEDLARLRDRYPPLERICHLNARPGAIESAGFQSGNAMVGEDGHCDVTRAYVFLENEGDALIAALALHVRPDTARVPVTVAVADANAGVALVLAAEGGRFAAVEPFGVLTSAVSSALLLGGNIEMLAQAKHAQFVRDLVARGQTRADHPAIVPWGELPESLKEANRRFADSAGRTFEAAGCVLVPLSLRESEAPTFVFTADELESLARAEHDRWMSDALADGWRPTNNTTEPKDAQRRFHPLLVPWEQLSEEEREKDRDTIRELPGIVELAGFRVQRP
jgi:hypothetical protein